MDYPKWKAWLIVFILAVGFVFALPNFVPDKYQSRLLKGLNRVTLGLDLQGGSQILLEVDVAQVFRDRLASFRQDATAALRAAGVTYRNVQVTEGAVSFEITSDVMAAMDVLSNIDWQRYAVARQDKKITVSFSEKEQALAVSAIVNQALEVVNRRVNDVGTVEPSIQRQGDNRIQVQLPGLSDPEMVKSRLGKMAKLGFHLVDETKLGDAYNDEMIVGGENLTDASMTYQEGVPVVAFKFDSIGSRNFGKATRENIGKRLAIVLDGEVISAPVVQSAITGGSGVITGQFTVDSASELASLLRAGALPAPLSVIEERVVGPGLGQDSIKAGKTACVIAIVLVAALMIGIYGWLGVIADVALMINAILLLASLSMLGATLTLPGIAGIALTMGMAVDANVLIYERIREEVVSGRSMLKALETGFTQAKIAIFDSNITTLAAAMFLFIFGYGPVRGFGITLSLGILTSMFTAVTVTYGILVFVTNKWKLIKVKV